MNMNTEYPVSPYVKVGGLVHFARMLSKIRLHAAGKLGPDYVPHLGEGFDGSCLQFLCLKYEELKQRTLAGGSDEEILQWAFEHGRGQRPCDNEIDDWNNYMVKRGWRDQANERLQMRIKEAHLEQHQPKVETFFDFIDADEKRVPPARWWE
jgi:gluconokinase